MPGTLRQLMFAAITGAALIIFNTSGEAKSDSSRKQISLMPLGTYLNGPPYDSAAASIVVYEPCGQRLFVVNSGGGRIDVLDISNPATPTKVHELVLGPAGTVALSVAVHEGFVAASARPADKTQNGWVIFYDRHLVPISSHFVGAYPDMITFTPNGRYLLVGNEGEPSGYTPATTDPEGSITIFDLHRGFVRTATFDAFNGVPLDPSVRLFGTRTNIAQELEPEYITVSDDSKTAWIALQENNAIATLDIESATITRIDGLGFKDHSLPGNGLDASDQDGGINIRNWPLKGVYMPDNVASYRVHGHTFLVTANEGDTRNWPGLNEEARVSTLNLNPIAFPDAAELKKPANLGRLTVSTVNADTNGDGTIDVLYSLGGRSFSIWTTTGRQVWDSGDDFEQIVALMFPANFNASHTSNTKDSRSTSKGPEPEGVTIGKVYGRDFAFIALERIGGVMVYDISDPYAPRFVDYVNTRTFMEPFSFPLEGDLGAESIAFITEEQSPTGKPLIAVANEISGSTTIFQINKEVSHR